MASSSAPTNEMKGLRLMESCTTSELTELESHTAVGCGSEHGSTSCCIVGSKSVGAMMETRSCVGSSQLEEKCGSCEGQWSEVSELATNVDEERAAEIDNKEVFKSLLRHPIAPNFFCTFGYNLGVKGRGSWGELEIGEKFAEGGQVELFHAKVTWKNPKENEHQEREGTKWVLKVFRKGTLLRHLQSQWPQGYLKFRAENLERQKLGKPNPKRDYCLVGAATLLKDGTFAFLMVKGDGDLCSIIDENMQRNDERNVGPFQNMEEAEMIMYCIALGMDWMHNHNIILRDLKAANVLTSRQGKGFGQFTSLIADFECSIGVVGTRFWRAPEVLQACKERNVYKRPELFTTQGDIYSYGMTCYEILTGRFPFDKHGVWDYDLVLNGNRSEVPEYVVDWAQELLKGCWQTNPMDRPLVRGILKVLEDNSKIVRRYKVWREATERALM